MLMLDNVSMYGNDLNFIEEFVVKPCNSSIISLELEKALIPAFYQVLEILQQIKNAIQQQDPQMLVQALKQQAFVYQNIIQKYQQKIQAIDNMIKKTEKVFGQNGGELESSKMLNKEIIRISQVIKGYQEMIQAVQRDIYRYQETNTGEEMLQAYLQVDYDEISLFDKQEIERSMDMIKICEIMESIR